MEQMGMNPAWSGRIGSGGKRISLLTNTLAIILVSVFINEWEH